MVREAFQHGGYDESAQRRISGSSGAGSTTDIQASLRWALRQRREARNEAEDEQQTQDGGVETSEVGPGSPIVDPNVDSAQDAIEQKKDAVYGGDQQTNDGGGRVETDEVGPGTTPVSGDGGVETDAVGPGPVPVSGGGRVETDEVGPGTTPVSGDGGVETDEVGPGPTIVDPNVDSAQDAIEQKKDAVYGGGQQTQDGDVPAVAALATGDPDPEPTGVEAGSPTSPITQQARELESDILAQTPLDDVDQVRIEREGDRLVPVLTEEGRQQFVDTRREQLGIAFGSLPGGVRQPPTEGADDGEPTLSPATGGSPALAPSATGAPGGVADVAGPADPQAIEERDQTGGLAELARGLESEVLSQTPLDDPSQVRIVRQGDRLATELTDAGREQLSDVRRERLVAGLEEQTGTDLESEDISVRQTGGEFRATLSESGQIAVARDEAPLQNTPLGGIFAAGAETNVRYQRWSAGNQRALDRTLPDVSVPSDPLPSSGAVLGAAGVATAAPEPVSTTTGVAVGGTILASGALLSSGDTVQRATAAPTASAVVQGSELPVAREIHPSELEVTEPRPASELGVGGATTEVSELEPGEFQPGSELEPGEFVPGSEIPVGGRQIDEGGETVSRDDSVVPGEYPLAGRDVPADPSREHVEETTPEDIAARASPVVEGELQQPEEEEEQPPDVREITGEDIVSDLPAPSEVPPSVRERMRRDDLLTPERQWPTGASAVIGETTSEGAELLEAAQRMEVAAAMEDPLLSIRPDQTPLAWDDQPTDVGVGTAVAQRQAQMQVALQLQAQRQAQLQLPIQAQMQGEDVGTEIQDEYGYENPFEYNYLYQPEYPPPPPPTPEPDPRPDPDPDPSGGPESDDEERRTLARPPTAADGDPAVGYLAETLSTAATGGSRVIEAPSVGFEPFDAPVGEFPTQLFVETDVDEEFAAFFGTGSSGDPLAIAASGEGFEGFGDFVAGGDGDDTDDEGLLAGGINFGLDPL